MIQGHFLESAKRYVVLLVRSISQGTVNSFLINQRCLYYICVPVELIGPCAVNLVLINQFKRNERGLHYICVPIGLIGPGAVNRF